MKESTMYTALAAIEAALEGSDGMEDNEEAIHGTEVTVADLKEAAKELSTMLMLEIND